jgi:hypothetical protein
MISIDLRKLAIAQRRAIWGSIAGFIGAVTHFYVAFAVIPFLLLCAWNLAKAANYGVFKLAIALLLMVLPVVNIFALVLMSHSAARTLKRSGLRVGAMGVKDCNLPG